MPDPKADPMTVPMPDHMTDPILLNIPCKGCGATFVRAFHLMGGQIVELEQRIDLPQPNKEVEVELHTSQSRYNAFVMACTM